MKKWKSDETEIYMKNKQKVEDYAKKLNLDTNLEHHEKKKKLYDFVRSLAASWD